MAFNPNNWAVISSSGVIPSQDLQNGSVTGAPGMYTYQSSTETAATISAANYFSPLANILEVNDFIYVSASDQNSVFVVSSVTKDPPAVSISELLLPGYVIGPASSTDKALARWNGTTGSILENSTVILSDAGDLTAVNSIANAAGTVSAPSYTFTGRTDVGVWSSAAHILDFSTNSLRALQLVSSPALSVNYLTIGANSATNPPTISAAGTDTNISILLTPKGSGGVVGPTGSISAPAFAFNGDINTGISRTASDTIDFSTGGLRAFQISAAPASSVNWLAVSGSATTTAPTMTATGTDNNIDINMVPKGTGTLAVVGATNAGTLKLWNAANTFFAAIKAATMASSITWVWPAADATVSGQPIVSDAAGNLSFSGAVPMTWIAQATTPATISPNTGYIITDASTVTLNVPATMAVGTVFAIVGQGAGGWVLKMNTGQVVNFGSTPSTSGGTLSSANRYDCVEVMCTVANTTFVVRSSEGSPVPA